MSERPTCRTCAFCWQRPDPSYAELGQCRRMPPVVLTEQEPFKRDRYPVLNAAFPSVNVVNQWCGEHKEDPR